MNDRLHQAVSHWIGRENRDGTREADAALAEVFRTMGLATPSGRFADRVMERAGLIRPRASAFAWPWRAALAASLVLAGLAAAFLPPILMKVVDPLSSVRLLEWSAALFLGLIHRLADSLSIWSGLVDAAYGMRLAFSTPPMIVAVVAALLLSTTAFRALYGVLNADRRRNDYVN